MADFPSPAIVVLADDFLAVPGHSGSAMISLAAVLTRLDWDVDVTGELAPFTVLAIAHGDYEMMWDRRPVQVVFDA